LSLVGLRVSDGVVDADMAAELGDGVFVAE
jgi:hypothetical protein